MAKPSKTYAVIKRTIDVVAASTALIVLSPLVLGVALVVRIKLGSPILFRQVRGGYHGAPFSILKFRTMTDARDEAGMLLPDADRLPAFGRFLRSTSIDELPSLINIICGDLTLVGPRPLLMRYLPRYNAEQQRRHEVRPGLTGLAQVSGRNALSWDDKLRLDVEYVDTRSLALDLRILVRTIGKVVQREGISSGESATMTEFMGSERPPQ